MSYLLMPGRFSTFCLLAIIFSVPGLKSAQADIMISSGSGRAEVDTSLLGTIGKDFYKIDVTICSTNASKDLYVSFGSYPYAFWGFSVKDDVTGK